jgi:hypothetical protein
LPNTFAYLALFAWPVVAVILFRALPLPRAIIWTILGGYLLLPEKTQVDFPLLPVFDKTFIPAASALLLCLTRLRNPMELLPRAPVPKILAILFLLVPFITIASNSDPVVFGPMVIRGLSLSDALAFGAAVVLIPFLLGQRFLASEAALRDLLLAIALAGLVYSLPALFEVRMSPQLHTWIYGFFPHSFGQMIRFGGFRPVIFLKHGLEVALFFSMALLATAALWRGHRGPAKAQWALAGVWLLLTLLLCKTVSAWFYAALFLPVVLFAGRRMQHLALLVIGLAILLYPALRGADLVPTGQVEAVAAVIAEERAASLRYRLENEDILLERANLKPLFGWAGWGRNRVYDPQTGEDISTTDGHWVIVIGQYGWVGYVAQFGLLVWPLIMLGASRAGRRASFAAIALGIVLSANLLDLIPNSGISPLTWMLAGGLTGTLARQPARALRPARADGPIGARARAPERRLAREARRVPPAGAGGGGRVR